MKAPIKVHAGIEDVRLGETDDVRARVAGVRITWQSRRGAGLWAFHAPVAVVDERGGRRRLRPVVDLNLVLVMALLVLTLAATRQRRGRGDGGRQPDATAD
ncbi:MAG TPA: hypothetical protein VNN10_06625 [Dehalococcoidia bacterium]|nr:hypothetical protein [Dehalococcoidia bacterium]